MKVFLSELAERKLLKLSEYLLEEWNVKTQDNFIKNYLKRLIKSRHNLKVVFNLPNLKDFSNAL